MYDKLANRLREPCQYENCVLCKEGEDAIEDLEFACNRYERDYKDLCAYLPKWIPVTERLPFAESGNVSEKVLVTDGQDVAIAEWFNFEMCEPFWSYTGMGDITHWQPLPAPPKEKA